MFRDKSFFRNVFSDLLGGKGEGLEMNNPWSGEVSYFFCIWDGVGVRIQFS